MTLNGETPLMEDNIKLKTNFDGRWSSMEDDLWSKMSRHTSIETVFKERQL